MTDEERKARHKEANRKTDRRPERIAAHNEYVRQNLDRINLTLPKGTKERIKSAGIDNMSGYIKSLLLADLERRERLEME